MQPPTEIETEEGTHRCCLLPSDADFRKFPIFDFAGLEVPAIVFPLTVALLFLSYLWYGLPNPPVSMARPTASQPLEKESEKDFSKQAADEENLTHIQEPVSCWLRAAGWMFRIFHSMTGQSLLKMCTESAPVLWFTGPTQILSFMFAIFAVYPENKSTSLTISAAWVTWSIRAWLIPQLPQSLDAIPACLALLSAQSADVEAQLDIATFTSSALLLAMVADTRIPASHWIREYTLISLQAWPVLCGVLLFVLRHGLTLIRSMPAMWRWITTTPWSLPSLSARYKKDLRTLRQRIPLIIEALGIAVAGWLISAYSVTCMPVNWYVLGRAAEPPKLLGPSLIAGILPFSLLAYREMLKIIFNDIMHKQRPEEKSFFEMCVQATGWSVLIYFATLTVMASAF